MVRGELYARYLQPSTFGMAGKRDLTLTNVVLLLHMMFRRGCTYRGPKEGGNLDKRRSVLPTLHKGANLRWKRLGRVGDVVDAVQAEELYLIRLLATRHDQADWQLSSNQISNIERLRVCVFFLGG
jgi:hypothetical protein